MRVRPACRAPAVRRPRETGSLAAARFHIRVQPSVETDNRRLSPAHH
ncbi:hypothetical protein BURCENBC7_AP4374 [Burkholderia cenocepacia BC7]|nr:uncharacterized protein BCN122_II3263 [Burkholderia cenocepacia]EPZ89080.1 hypothetical protein BURCENK562V_C5062 [Burkholderia cenocepacia K56-2Valvano]ERI28320.1 hypothetical protein BURCENBC7_AP4374 [Burkholderia cenocepacia BC7]